MSREFKVTVNGFNVGVEELDNNDLDRIRYDQSIRVTKYVTKKSEEELDWNALINALIKTA